MNKTLEAFFAKFKEAPKPNIADKYLSGEPLPANYFKPPELAKILPMATPKNCWACPVNFDCELKPIHKCKLYRVRRSRGIIWADWWDPDCWDNGDFFRF